MSEMAGHPSSGGNDADDKQPGEQPTTGIEADVVSPPEQGTASREAPEGPMSGGGEPDEGVQADPGRLDAADAPDTGSAVGRSAQRQQAPGAVR